jgi:hypothetical protein
VEKVQRFAKVDVLLGLGAARRGTGGGRWRLLLDFNVHFVDGD